MGDTSTLYAVTMPPGLSGTFTVRAIRIHGGANTALTQRALFTLPAGYAHVLYVR